MQLCTKYTIHLLRNHTMKMTDVDLLIESTITEAPLGFMKRGGLKAASAIGKPFGAEFATGADAELDTGALANTLKQEYVRYLRSTGQKPDSDNLEHFIQSAGLGVGSFSSAVANSLAQPSTGQKLAGAAGTALGAAGYAGQKIAGAASKAAGAIKNKLGSAGSQQPPASRYGTAGNATGRIDPTFDDPANSMTAGMSAAAKQQFPTGASSQTPPPAAATAANAKKGFGSAASRGAGSQYRSNQQAAAQQDDEPEFSGNLPYRGRGKQLNKGAINNFKQATAQKGPRPAANAAANQKTYGNLGVGQQPAAAPAAQPTPAATQAAPKSTATLPAGFSSPRVGSSRDDLDNQLNTQVAAKAATPAKQTPARRPGGAFTNANQKPAAQTPAASQKGQMSLPGYEPGGAPPSKEEPVSNKPASPVRGQYRVPNKMKNDPGSLGTAANNIQYKNPKSQAPDQEEPAQEPAASRSKTPGGFGKKTGTPSNADNRAFPAAYGRKNSQAPDQEEPAQEPAASRSKTPGGFGKKTGTPSNAEKRVMPMAYGHKPGAQGKPEEKPAEKKAAPGSLGGVTPPSKVSLSSPPPAKAKPAAAPAKPVQQKAKPAAAPKPRAATSAKVDKARDGEDYFSKLSPAEQKAINDRFADMNAKKAAKDAGKPAAAAKFDPKSVAPDKLQQMVDGLDDARDAAAEAEANGDPKEIARANKAVKDAIAARDHLRSSSKKAAPDTSYSKDDLDAGDPEDASESYYDRYAQMIAEAALTGSQVDQILLAITQDNVKNGTVPPSLRTAAQPATSTGPAPQGHYNNFSNQNGRGIQPQGGAYQPSGNNSFAQGYNNATNGRGFSPMQNFAQGFRATSPARKAPAGSGRTGSNIDKRALKSAISKTLNGDTNLSTYEMDALDQFNRTL